MHPSGTVKDPTSWKEVRRIVAAFQKLNPYDRAMVPGSILNIVEDINFDSAGKQRPVYGYRISAKRYALYTRVMGQRRKLSRPASTGWGFTTGRRKVATQVATCHCGSRKAGNGF